MAKKSDKKRGSKSLREMLKSRLGRFLAIFFVSAWMFVLGVLVGRGTAPVRFNINALDAELADLKAREQQQRMTRAKIDPRAADPKTDLEFYEELKKSQKPAALKARQPADQPKSESKKPSPKVVKKETPKPAGEKASKPSKTEAVKNKPAVRTKAGKAPAAGSESTTDGLTVQAASLKDPKDADDLVSRLKKKGYPAYKTIAVVPQQGIWFRVRVGRFGSREEAAETLKRLKKDGFDPFLVKRTE